MQEQKDFFDLSFWQGFVTTFLGALLGILVALYTDKIIKRRDSKKEREVLTVALKDAFEKNYKVIIDLKRQYEKTNMPSNDYLPDYSLDMVFLESTSWKKYEILQTLSSRGAIYDAIYELIQLRDKLKTLRNVSEYLYSLSNEQRVYQLGIITRGKEQLAVTEKAIENVIRALSK